MPHPEIPSTEAENKSVRRLAAIMFTDIVGFTDLNQRNEAQALEVLELHNRLVRPFFSKFGGREVKTIGDSFLVEFENVLDATLCAVEIQKFIHDYDASVIDERKIRVRIGIHLGDVVRKGSDIFGDAVNIASRIQPLANPEGVCVSEQVFDQIHNKTDYEFVQVKEAKLKNVSFATNVYSVMMPWEKGAKGDQGGSFPASRIAVLPFTNMSLDPQDAFFADGITEEIITTLSGINALKVISRTSVMGFKGTTKKLTEIGNELKVGSILEGSFRKIGNRIRVTAQLIDVSSDNHLWAQNYDRNLDDVFAIQSEIASSISDQLKIRLVEPVKEKPDTTDIDAYTMFVKASQLQYESDEGSLRQAKSLLEQALGKDPKFVRALARLSQVWVHLVNHGYEDFTAGLSEAETAARRSVQLDPESADAHQALAQVLYHNDRYEDAMQEAQKAISINPNSSIAHHWLGTNDFFIFGRKVSGLQEIEKAYSLDPLFAPYVSNLARSYLVLGRKEQALDLLIKFRDLNPKNVSIHESLSFYYLHNRDYEKSREALEAAEKLDPARDYWKVYDAVLFALTGEKEKARRNLEASMNSKGESMRIYAQLFVGTALGDFDLAFRALGEAADRHSWPVDIKLNPFFDELRKDQRFKDFCLKVRIPTD